MEDRASFWGPAWVNSDAIRHIFSFQFSKMRAFVLYYP